VSQVLETLGEELRVAEEEMRAQHELIEALLRGRSAERVANLLVAAALPVAVVETDSNGLVVWANPAAGALFRVEGWQLRGKPLMARVQPPDRWALRTALAEATARVGTRHVSLRVAPLHGRAFLVNMAIIGAADPARGGLAGRAASDADKAPTVRFVITPAGRADSDVESSLLVALGSVSVLSAFDGDMRSTLSRVATLAAGRDHPGRRGQPHRRVTRRTSAPGQYQPPGPDRRRGPVQGSRRTELGRLHHQRRGHLDLTACRRTLARSRPRTS
jgi:PAS domain-containing protein